ILDHDGIVAASELDERLAPSRRQRYAQGELVRWRDADDFGIARQLLDDQPLGVDAHRNDLRTRGRHGYAHRWITPVFHHHGGLAGCHQDSGEKVESLLRTRGHEHLSRPTSDRTRKCDVARYGGAEVEVSLMSLWALITCWVALEAAQPSRAHLPEDLKRKQSRVHQTGPEFN